MAKVGLTELRQFAVFSGVGIACTLLDFTLLVLLLQFGINTLVATAIGFLAGLFLNVMLHTRVTFESKLSSWVLLRFMVVVGMNFALTLGLVEMAALWAERPLLGKLIAVPMVAINGFLLSKTWVFK